ncbi:MAG: uracil phosphoribosyltransferase [Bacteroidaceae bacterium]|nr:uracil phosphoribosyltransferase [Bacteroidaceae bacterium]
MEIINLSQRNTILNQYVAELRDVNIQGDRMRFRHNLERIGQMMAYEVSQRLTYSTKDVQTPLGIAKASTPDNALVVATVFRAGLPLHTGFLNVFDRADNAFVSAYRYYKDKECSQVDVRIEYIATPRLDGRTLMLVDPMLATGESMELALEAFCTKGKPAHTHIAAVIASEQGVEHLKKVYGDRDDVTLWCAVIDPELNEHSYIVPGLGDAGDLAFGEKL